MADFRHRLKDIGSGISTAAYLIVLPVAVSALWSRPTISSRATFHGGLIVLMLLWSYVAIRLGIAVVGEIRGRVQTGASRGSPAPSSRLPRSSFPRGLAPPRHRSNAPTTPLSHSLPYQFPWLSSQNVGEMNWFSSARCLMTRQSIERLTYYGNAMTVSYSN